MYIHPIATNHETEHEMNAERRRLLTNLAEKTEKIMGQLSDLSNELDAIKDAVDDIREQEQEARDNMPESLADSERAQISDAAISNMENAVSEIDGLISTLTDDTITQSITHAAE